MAGPDPIGPISREFLRNVQKFGMKNGAQQWVPKFWNSMQNQQYARAKNYLSTIKSIINNQKAKAIAQELAAVVPEMEAALLEAGVTTEAASAATAELATIVETLETGAALGAEAALLPEVMTALAIGALVVAVVFFSGKAYADEMPPSAKLDPGVNPAQSVNREYLLKYFGQGRHIPKKAGH